MSVRGGEAEKRKRGEDAKLLLYPDEVGEGNAVAQNSRILVEASYHNHAPPDFDDRHAANKGN